MLSIGEALVAQLVERGVDIVFGIPGVHTVELYRGLSSSKITHITPRHEQGAGFMADGYARVSGKPGVAFVITGPGFTNTLTAMGQARADSVPILVISGVNSLPSLGKGWGHLHELPDQQAMAKTVALVSERVEKPKDLIPALDKAFDQFNMGRPGPAHIEIPLDVAGVEYRSDSTHSPQSPISVVNNGLITDAVELLKKAKSPVILVGGGARHADKQLRILAETMDAPVIQTVNARGLMHKHPLTVPASPSLLSVRELIEGADVVLALGTELGQTDYDMYATGSIAKIPSLIRVDLSAEQLSVHPATIALKCDVVVAIDALLQCYDTEPLKGDGMDRAAETRQHARDEIGSEMRELCDLLATMRTTIPNAIIVGDSVYPIYAGNLYYDHDRPGGWFNAATGFGALGYGIPAAIGAALAAPGAPVICIVGDGGSQFSLPELMCAVDEKLPITFIIWNNHGYQEIATSMQAVGITVLGCDPTPPDFEFVARSCGMPFWRVSQKAIPVAEALLKAQDIDGPRLIEICSPNIANLPKI